MKDLTEDNGGTAHPRGAKAKAGFVPNVSCTLRANSPAECVAFQSLSTDALLAQRTPETHQSKGERPKHDHLRPTIGGLNQSA